MDTAQTCDQWPRLESRLGFEVANPRSEFLQRPRAGVPTVALFLLRRGALKASETEEMGLSSDLAPV